MAQEIANSTLLDTWGSSGAKIEPDISKIIEGWQLGEQPPHEYMNWLQNTFGSKLNHILKNGVAKWNNETEYLAGATIQHNSNVWLCKVTNTNSEPTDANVNWDKMPSLENLALTVDTINDFPTSATTGDTCIVKDLDRGGIFIYDSTKVDEDNQGTNFNGWIRQYSGAVNVKWFGANESRIDNEVPFNIAISLFSDISIPKGIYKTSQSIIIDKPTRLYGTVPSTTNAGSSTNNNDNSTVIQYSGSGIAMAIVSNIGDSIEGVNISGFTIEGTSSGLCGLCVGDYANITGEGKTLAITKSTFKDITLTDFTATGACGLKLSHVFTSEFTNIYSKRNNYGLLNTWNGEVGVNAAINDDATTIAFNTCSFRENEFGILIQSNAYGWSFNNCLIESNFGYGVRMAGGFVEKISFNNCWFEGNVRNTVAYPELRVIEIDKLFYNGNTYIPHFLHFTHCSFTENGRVNVWINYGDRIDFNYCGSGFTIEKETTAQSIIINSPKQGELSSGIAKNDIVNPLLINSGSTPTRVYKSLSNLASHKIEAKTGFLLVQDRTNMKQALISLEGGLIDPTILSQTDDSSYRSYPSFSVANFVSTPADIINLIVTNLTDGLTCSYMMYNNGAAPTILYTDDAAGTHFGVGTGSGGFPIKLYYQASTGNYVLENQSGETKSITTNFMYKKPHFGDFYNTAKVNIQKSAGAYYLQNNTGATAEFVYSIINPDGY